MSEEQMNKVFVELYNMLLSEKTDDYSGRVLTKHITEEELVRLAREMIGSDINTETYHAVMNIMKRVAIREIANGGSVQFGLGYFSLDVRGVFIGEHAKWDPNVNSLHVKVTASEELREAVKKAHVEVRGLASSGAFINSVTDAESGEVNTRLTPGGGLTISGVKIKIAGPSSSNRIEIIDDIGIGYDVPAKSVLTNTPTKITFIVPQNLPKGKYRVKLTTQYSTSSTLLKAPRSITFNQELEVK
jgi:hypothetical protein